MAGDTTPIDIEVRDAIAATITTKLLAIAQAALQGADSVDKLNVLLAKIDGGNLSALAQAQKAVADQTNKNNLAYLAEETALNKAVAAEARAAASQATLAAAQAKTQAAVQASAAASDAAAARLLAAQAGAEAAQTRAAAAAQKAADASAQAAKNDTNSTAALIAKARAIQTAADAQDQYNRILGVNSTSKSAKDSASVFIETEAAAKSAASAVNAFGETEAQVEARIKSVAAAGAALSKAQTSVGITATEAGNAEKTLTANTNTAATAAQNAAKRYSDYMSALNTIGKTPSATTATVSPTATNQATAAIKSNTAALNENKAAAEGASFANAGVTRELIVLGHEVVSGNFNRIPGSLLVLAERTNGIGGAISLLLNTLGATGSIVGILVIGLGALAAAFYSAEKANNVFLGTLKLSGNLAGLTIDSYRDLVDQIAKANSVTISSSKDVVSALALSGQFTRTEVEQLGNSIIQYSKITGQSTDDVIKDFIKAGESPGQFAQKLIESTKIISPAVAEQVRVLDQLGDKTKALEILSQGIFDYFNSNGAQALTGINGFWHDLGVTIVNVGSYVKDFLRISAGLSTVGEQLNAAVNSVNLATKAQNALRSIGGNGAADLFGGVVNYYQNQVDGIQAKTQAQQDAATATAKATEADKAAIVAGDLLSGKFKLIKGNAQQAADEISEFHKQLNIALADPKTANLPSTQNALANSSAIEAQINKKYAPPKVAKTPTTPAESREAILAKDNAELDKQLIAYDQIASVRTALQKLDQIDVQLSTHTKDGKLAPLQKLTDAEKASYLQKLQTIEINKRVQSSEDSIYANAVGPLQKLQDGQTAITQLRQNSIKVEKDLAAGVINTQEAMQRGLFTEQQAGEAQRALNYAYDSATDPLFAFNKNLKDQNALLDANVDSQHRAALAAVQSENNRLAPKGEKLSNDDTQKVIEGNLALQRRNELQSAYDQIYNTNVDAYRQQTIQQEALNKAYANGAITLESYSAQTTQLAIARAQLNLDTGKGNQNDVFLAGVGKIIAGYKSALSELSNSFGQFFDTLDKGFADSVGHAVVFGGSLKDSLLDVVRNGVSALISSLVQVGIQYLLNQALGQQTATSSVTNTTTQSAAVVAGMAAQAIAGIAATEAVAVASATSGASIASAWAPAAAAVSLASYGANAVPAGIGITAVYALATLLSKSGAITGGGSGAASSTTSAGNDISIGYASGGYTGNGAVDEVAGYVHGKEFVVNADATQANRAALEAINAGAIVGNNSSGAKAVQMPTSSSGMPKITINNTGTPQTYTAQFSEGEIRMMARDEAGSVVTKRAPSVIAADMRNPNGATQKALQTTTKTQRVKA